MMRECDRIRKKKAERYQERMQKAFKARLNFALKKHDYKLQLAKFLEGKSDNSVSVPDGSILALPSINYID